MIIDAANLATLRQGLNTRFAKGLQAAPSLDVDRIATVVPSGTLIENYPMMAFLDTIKKWVGPRQLGTLLAKNLAVTNENYEATIGIPANAIEDDQVGIYGEIAEGKGRQCRALWIQLAIAALVGNGKWLDGSDFFLTTRKFNKSTINNKTTGALSAANYATAYTAMMSYQAHDGEPLEIVPDLLVVGPSNMETAKKIVDIPAELTSGATGESTYVNWTSAPNPWYKTAELIVHPRLVGDYANYWFLMSTTGVVKPILVQKRKEGALVALDKPTDANVFFGSATGSDDAIPGGVYVYGAHYRGAAAMTLPHLCYGGLAT
jgi:phage major head subunit gpT-like protein